MGDWKKAFKKIWQFIWDDDSIWSWLVNVVIAFVLIKFVVYPGLGFLLATSHPVVAVVSESMEHDSNFEQWWEKAGGWYESNGITKRDFEKFSLKNGFDKGDIIVLHGKKPKDIKVGDIIVFWSAKKDPIIHRAVKKLEENNIYYFQTKGDNYRTNPVPIKTVFLDENNISQEHIVGNSLLRIPLLGYIKIWFVEFLNIFQQNL